MKKRFVTIALVLCLMLNLCPVPALAAPAAPVSAGNGELCLTLHREGAVAATEFTLELRGEDGAAVKTARVTAEQGETVSAVSVPDIPDGTYTLHVSAEGYLPYAQTLTYDSAQEANCVQLDLYNYVSVNEGSSGRGVMPAGDVNGDGAIDDADADAVTAAMGTADAKCDVDGSGTVDLLDLTIVVRNQGGCALATPVYTVSSTVLAQTLDVTAGAGTAVTGTPADLLDQQKTDTAVTLRPAQEDAAISEENPVELTLEPKADAPENTGVPAEAIVIVPPVAAESTITAGVVTIETVDGEIITAPIVPSDDQTAAPAMLFAARSTAPGVTVESNGTVVIDLGRQVAIKKVTIVVTGASQDNLAEIAKVEFLSDFAQRIPEPQLSIPRVLSVSNTESDGQGYKDLTVTWSPENNITGYEVSVTGPGYTKTASTSRTSYTFQGDSFNGTVESFKTYQVKVRSVSGDWKSQWSEPFSHMVTCTKVPPRPQYLTAEAGVNSLKVTWNCKFDAESYTLYYKPADAETYSVREGLTSPGCTLTGLQSGVKYTLYVVAHNRNGSSPKSADAEGVPTSASGTEMPNYKLLNTVGEDGMADTHITGISGNNKSYTIYKADGSTVTNSNATAEDWKTLLDGEPDSYLLIPDWDSGVTYSNFRGPIIRLDERYTMDTIRMTPFEGSGVHMNAVKVGYHDENGAYQTVGTSFYTRYDSQNRRYYEVVLDRPITTDYLEVRTSTSYGATQNYTICEVRLYHYDDLEDTVAALFKDEARTELYEDVTMEQIDALITRTEETVDPVSGEHHPHKATILADLEYAKGLLEHTATATFLTVDNQVTAKGSPANGFAQALSDYQPLGCVAAAGDVVVLYVIDKDGNTAKGSNVELKLVATQYHPQVRAWQSGAIQLKAGRNEITIPKIGSDATERGGSLYLQYTGAKGARNYEVRVTGTTQIPTLRLDGVAGAERTAAIEAYVEELRDYAGNVETLHTQLHGDGQENISVRYDYDVKNCFLNATEITMENMMYTLPATQVWAAISGGDPAGNLESSVAAMEQTIGYFYQFKGLHPDAQGPDAYPFTRLNIRYHQMFTGAFMYAGGKHIGIEYGSTGDLFGLSPVTTDAGGKRTGGRLFGWGIAHEIGHCINASAYQRVEVTNNVFAQLAKTDETSGSFRTNYGKVYKAVATGTTGHTGDLAVQLAMYWQLHLAYDNDYTYKRYDTVEAQQAGLFYARLESYLRTPGKAPHAFTATGGDQLFMQAACAAAEKDILDFFRAWGIYPDAATEAYAGQYGKEARKIQYIDDDSRLYRLEGGTGMSAGTAVQASITNATDSRVNGNQVVISLADTNTAPGAMLGYEICRNGKMVAFVPAGTASYTDIVTTENNKAFVYTVTGVDKLLGETETVELPEVKVCHDGAISKDGWSAATNMTSVKDTTVEKDADDPDAGLSAGVEKVSAITAALDNDASTVYYGASSGSNNRPWVTLDLGGVEQVTALKFTPAPEGYAGDASGGTPAAGDLYKYRLFGYKIEVSLDGAAWTTVKEGNAFTGNAGDPSSWVAAEDVISNADGSYTLFFNRWGENGELDPFMYTYDAAYVRVTATNMSALAVAELDVLGPTGDNVELVPEGFGRLRTDFTSSGETIPAGSILFYGTYKGDPSYNVVLLKDQNGNTINGQQLIFAQVPENGPLGETCDGRWFYWLENETALAGIETVRADLYRVQDAQTLTGQRLTSTSLTMTIPGTIGDVEITSQEGTQAYRPDEAMVAAAMNWTETANVAGTVSDLPGGLYGDTGSAETGEDPVHLSAAGSRVTYQIKPADGVALAVQVGFEVSPAAASIQVQPGKADGLYQSSRYAGGRLELYAVARKGNIGGVTFTGTMSGADKDCTVTARSMNWLDSVLGPIHDYDQGEEGPAITASAQLTAAGAGNTGNTGSTGTSRPSASGTGTVSGSQATVTTTVSGGAASGELSGQAASELAANTPKDGQAVVEVDAPADAGEVSVTLPASLAGDLADGRSLTVDTPLGQVDLPSEALAELGKSSKSVTVAVRARDGVYTVTISQAGSAVETLPGGVTVRLPAEDSAGTVAVLVNGDGSETILKKAVVSQGVIRVPMAGSGSVKLSDNSKPFQDVQNHWGKEGIDFVSSRELFLGTSEDGTLFSPDAKMSRAMLATVLYRLEDGPAVAGAVRFHDVTTGLWYTQGVTWAAEKGIIVGQGDGTFAPQRDITREELATMIYRYAKLLGMDTAAEADGLARFWDGGDVSGWAREAMNWAVSRGIIGGMGGGELAPKGPATRAQVAAVLERLIKLM